MEDVKAQLERLVVSESLGDAFGSLLEGIVYSTRRDGSGHYEEEDGQGGTFVRIRLGGSERPSSGTRVGDLTLGELFATAETRFLKLLDGEDDEVFEDVLDEACHTHAARTGERLEIWKDGRSVLEATRAIGDTRLTVVYDPSWREEEEVKPGQENELVFGMDYVVVIEED